MANILVADLLQHILPLPHSINHEFLLCIVSEISGKKKYKIINSMFRFGFYSWPHNIIIIVLLIEKNVYAE